MSLNLPTSANSRPLVVADKEYHTRELFEPAIPWLYGFKLNFRFK